MLRLFVESWDFSMDEIFWRGFLGCFMVDILDLILCVMGMRVLFWIVNMMSWGVVRERIILVMLLCFVIMEFLIKVRLEV